MRHITMKIGLYAILVFVVVAMVSSTAAADVWPTVSLDGFNTDTFEYTYKIVCPADMTYDFGQFWVFGQMANAEPFPWEFGAATPFPADTWAKDFDVWGDDYGVAKWITNGDVVTPGTEWTGYFRITVPNSEPKSGLAYTANGDPESWKDHTVDVMAPALIPEPGTLMSFGLLAGGLIPFLKRRR